MNEPALVYTSAPTERCDRCGKTSSYVVEKPEGDGRETVCGDHIGHAIGAVLYA